MAKTTQSTTKPRATSKSPPKPAKKPRKWSSKVIQKSNSLAVQPRTFTSKDPKKLSRSLKRSALKGKRKKGAPLQPGMSMLTFYIHSAVKICRPLRQTAQRREHEAWSTFSMTGTVHADHQTRYVQTAS